ncbi:hypothetical protein FLONG3_11215 [Fusarium longipes]|uniref:Uncharacterized protein n=1 Tax=Fusarium longipes TaxID=694270 RepID=A0A395RGY0_9HYPO|nr:hypothetical protein FLONG3_11215 [Fusarium longipes]
MMLKQAIAFIFGFMTSEDVRTVEDACTIEDVCTFGDHDLNILIPPPHGKEPQILFHERVDPFAITRFPRTEFTSKIGGIVHGWPAKGGYYSKLCSVAELEFLGLDRFEPASKSEDLEEEEAHCARMRQLGARYYRNPDHQFDAQKRYYHWDPDEPKVFIGWPANGGVWFLRTTARQEIRQGLGRIGMAFTMEERCKMIDHFGGEFFADPKDCPHLDLDGSREQAENEKVSIYD